LAKSGMSPDTKLYTYPPLEQAHQQEPVAWVKRATEWLLDLPNTPTDAPYFTNGVFKGDCQELAALLQTSTAPPQRQPLTDEEIQKMRYLIDWTAGWTYITFARAIEAAHGITASEAEDSAKGKA
jgi:hypothetical protein